MEEYKKFLTEDGTYGLMKPVNLKAIIDKAKQEVFDYIEKIHIVNITDKEREDHIKFGNYKEEEVDKMFNVWIPYHGWMELKKRHLSNSSLDKTPKK